MRSPGIRCNFRYVRARFTEYGVPFGPQGAKGCSDEPRPLRSRLF